MHFIITTSWSAYTWGEVLLATAKGFYDSCLCWALNLIKAYFGISRYLVPSSYWKSMRPKLEFGGVHSSGNLLLVSIRTHCAIMWRETQIPPNQKQKISRNSIWNQHLEYLISSDVNRWRHEMCSEHVGRTEKKTTLMNENLTWAQRFIIYIWDFMKKI